MRTLELESDKNYVIGLTEFLTFNSISNVDKHSNKFHVGEEIISILPGSYEIKDIEKKFNFKIRLSLKVNHNTLSAAIKCNKKIDFPAKNSLGRLLGSRLYKAYTLYTSNLLYGELVMGP